MSQMELIMFSETLICAAVKFQKEERCHQIVNASKCLKWSWFYFSVTLIAEPMAQDLNMEQFDMKRYCNCCFCQLKDEEE